MDVFDLEALVDLMRAVRSRKVRVVEVETQLSSPFSSSLLFEYIAQYMYEGDTPLAERRAQALTLDRELLSELLGSDDLRELLDTEVIAETELELQGLSGVRRPRDVDEAHDLFRRVGDLTTEEAVARGVGMDWLETLAQSHRIISIRIAGEDRWIAAEDASRYRDALGVSLPLGLPGAYLEPSTDSVKSLLRRWALTHAPFRPEDPASRWSLPVDAINDELERMASANDLVAGHFRAGASTREYCSNEVLRVIRRRSLAALRREVEPVPAGTLGQFLPAWQGVGNGARGIERLADIVQQLQGTPVPVGVLERDIFPSRMASYAPQLLDQLVASGEVVWVGRGSLGLTDGRVSLYFRSDVAKLSPDPVKVPSREPHDGIRERLQLGACFFPDLQSSTEWGDREELLDALWEMVWSGEVTNDTYAPLRFIGPSRRSGRRGVPVRLGPPRSLGRWSLVEHLVATPVAPTVRVHAQAESLLQRYGILTREPALAEGVEGGFVRLYPVLRSMEESGKLRRGYFIEGLGGAQFALPGAVDRLRSFRQPDTGQEHPLLLAATDPANPYGIMLPWPEMPGRAARVSAAYVVLEGGELRLFVERGGRSILTNGEVGLEHLEKLTAIASRHGKLEIRFLNGMPVTGSDIGPALEAAGFTPTHRGYVVYPERSGQRSA